MLQPDLIITGGQTGVDYGALIAAKNLNISTGGYAPLNFLTETGPEYSLGSKFGLIALSGGYSERTAANVSICDAVIVIARNFESPGTKLTIRTAQQKHKPIFSITPECSIFDSIFGCREWLNRHCPRILMFAGNRESVAPGIGQWTENYIRSLFQ